MMASLYHKALIIGGTSGIGASLAEHLTAEGTQVIITGRRQDRLDGLSRTHGASAIPFDVLSVPSIPSFAADMSRDHPDLDCLVINAGVQRAFDFSRPASLDLASFDMELTTNYTSAVHLTAAFLPILQRQPQSHIVYVGATLGLVPSLVRTPGYNASKAALHAFVMAVRQQLKDAEQEGVRLVEVFPPAVRTELHDEKHQPDLMNGGEIGMPLESFTKAMYEGLVRGDEQFAVGPGEEWLKKGGWEDMRTEMFHKGRVLIQKSLAPFLKK